MTFTVHRLLGAGDVEHVRHSLLQVSALDKQHIVKQAAAAFRLGDTLKMMVRLHVNADILDGDEKTQLLNCYLSNLSHQLEQWSGLTRPDLAKKVSNCELYIETDSTSPRVRRSDSQTSVRCEIDTLYETLLSVWQTTGGRLLGGNFARLPKEQLMTSLPQLSGTVE